MGVVFMKLKALSAVIVCCLAFSLLSCTPPKNTYPEETSFNVVFSDVVDLGGTNQVEATFSLGLENDYDKKYSENLVYGWGIAKIHPYNVDDLFLLWDEINEYPADKYSYKIDENNKEIFNFTEKYSIPTSFFNSHGGWFCVCIYKREFYNKTFSGTFSTTYKYTVSESILRIERETDVSKMI